MPSPVSNRQVLWIALVLSGLLLLILTTLSLVLHFAFPKAPKDAPGETAITAPSDGEKSHAATPHAQVPPAPPAPPQHGARREEPPPLPDPTLVQTNAHTEPKAEQASWLPREEQEQVNKTIDRGVQWLKERQGGNGSWGPRPGLAALPALTLLECGVPAGDTRIQKALQLIRRAVRVENRTYDLSLIILFLDRLGDPADKTLIQTCALRLVAGQMASGGWTYACPILAPKQGNDLLTVMRDRRPKNALDLFVGGAGGSAPPGFLARDPAAPVNKAIQGEPSGDSKLLPEDSPPPRNGNLVAKDSPSPEAAKRAWNRLPAELRKVPSLQPPRKSHKLPRADHSDNSNTQFAILGLLAAARHDLPLERTFALIVQRFHSSQVSDGRWNYHFSAPAQAQDLRPAMTGAGLLGLAVQFGLAADHFQLQAKSSRFDNPAVEKGFTYLSQFIGEPTDWNLYLLWTVERCGVLYHRRQIAGKDWYPWGVRLLLDHQKDDGSWNQGGYFADASITPITDTCFALLFLKRANLAKELTKKLEFFIEGKQLQAKP